MRPTVVGLSLTGKFRQFNASPTFSLIRFETDGPALWFKATGEPNLHELPITVSLTRLFPGYLPPILGVHPLWNAWLCEEISSTTLDQFTELFAWVRVAEKLAELQIASIGKCCRLLDNQCRDLRLSKLVDLIPPFLARMAEFMAAQQKQPPIPLTIRELDFLENDYKRPSQSFRISASRRRWGHRFQSWQHFDHSRALRLSGLGRSLCNTSFHDFRISRGAPSTQRHCRRVRMQSSSSRLSPSLGARFFPRKTSRARWRSLP